MGLAQVAVEQRTRGERGEQHGHDDESEVEDTCDRTAEGSGGAAQGAGRVAEDEGDGQAEKGLQFLTAGEEREAPDDTEADRDGEKDHPRVLLEGEERVT